MCAGCPVVRRRAAGIGLVGAPVLATALLRLMGRALHNV
jgi:hypothetical protein